MNACAAKQSALSQIVRLAGRELFFVPAVIFLGVLASPDFLPLDFAGCFAMAVFFVAMRGDFGFVGGSTPPSVA